MDVAAYGCQPVGLKSEDVRGQKLEVRGREAEFLVLRAWCVVGGLTGGDPDYRGSRKVEGGAERRTTDEGRRTTERRTTEGGGRRRMSRSKRTRTINGAADGGEGKKFSLD